VTTWRTAEDGGTGDPLPQKARSSTIGPASTAVLLPFIIFAFPILGIALAVGFFFRAIRWVDRVLASI
jgi:hypothetical protein